MQSQHLLFSLLFVEKVGGGVGGWDKEEGPERRRL